MLIEDLSFSEEMDSTAKTAVKGGGGFRMVNTAIAILNRAPTNLGPLSYGRPAGGTVSGTEGSGTGWDYSGSSDPGDSGLSGSGGYMGDGGDYRPF